MSKSLLEREQIELVRENLPETPFFEYADLPELTGFSRSFWDQKRRDGALHVIQPRPGRQGSRIKVPRSSVIDCLAAMVC